MPEKIKVNYMRRISIKRVLDVKDGNLSMDTL